MQCSRILRRCRQERSRAAPPMSRQEPSELAGRSNSLHSEARSEARSEALGQPVAQSLGFRRDAPRWLSVLREISSSFHRDRANVIANLPGFDIRRKLKCKRGTDDPNKNCSRDESRGPCALQIYGGHLGRGRKIVGLWFSQNYKRGVSSTDAG